MEPSDFYFFVAPLGFLLAILALMVFYYARREERVDKELKQLKTQLRLGIIDKETFEHRRTKLVQDKAFKEEMERLQSLLHNKSIDEDTFLRLKKILARARMIEDGYEHVDTDSDGRMHFKKMSDPT